MLIAVPLLTAEIWKEVKHPPTGKWINSGTSKKQIAFQQYKAMSFC